MAKYNIDSLPQMIELGRQGENGVRAITIDCGEMLARWSGAEIVLRAVRPGEETPYIVTTTMDSDGVMTWQPDTTDTAYAGTGRAELRCTVDGKIEKSAMFATCITAALNDVDGDKADAPSSWTQAVLDAADRVTGIGATAVTLDAGADATVTSDGKTLTFGIPRGNDGVSPTVETNQTEGGATVTITDASGAHTLTLSNGAQGIQGERGLQGVQGIQGEKGEKGDKGDTGVQGIQGVQGEKGADGVSPKVTVTQSDDGTVISVTDAEGTTSATVKGGGESVQADWAQNDSTAKDYIKNRVGGYGAERVYTWDGTVTDDMATVTYNGSTFYYAEGLATGDEFNKLELSASIPVTAVYKWVEGSNSGVNVADTTVSKDDSTGYYLISIFSGEYTYVIVSRGVTDVSDGVYILRDVYDSDNGYYDFISSLTLGSIAKIPTKYLPVTDEITEGSAEPISSGAIYDMPRLEYSYFQYYKWDGNATSESFKYDTTAQTFYKVDMYDKKYDANYGGIKATDLPIGTVTLKYQYGTFTGTAKYEDVTINGNNYWAMSAANSGYYQALIGKDNGSVYFAMCDMIGPGKYYLPELKIARPIALQEGFIPTTDTATSGSTTPITSGGVYTLLGDVESLLKGV